MMKNLIRVLCNANTSEGFKPQRDVSIPEINIPGGHLGPPRLTHSSGHERPILAFFAGGSHGYIRKILLQYWKDKDEEVQVHEYLAKNKDYNWPFFVFLGGSMFCLLASSICHLFCCHSKDLNVFLLRIDYAGITAMIITSFFPPIFYIFQCTPRWYFIYLAGITSMGIFTIITLFTPSLSSPKYRAFRALLFASMGLFGIVPAIHALVVNWGNPQRNVTLVYELAMAVFYLVGTGFYVGRVPERLKPGWFDRVGHSHQIFHVFVVLGALSHYAAALLFLDYRDHVHC